MVTQSNTKELKDRRFFAPLFKQRNRELIQDYILVAPALIILLVLVVYPIVTGIYLSFIDYNLLREVKPFVGLGNYAELFADPRFFGIIWNTIIFAVLANLISTVLGLAAALMLNETGPFIGLLRALAYLPWITPAVVYAVVWGWMYNGTFSPISSALIQWGIIDTPVSFLGNTDVSFLGLTLPVWSTLMVRIWSSYPFKMTMLLAALQSIPKDRIDAARVDGANGWQVFRHITLPGIMPVMLVIVSLSMIWNLSHFEVNFLLTGGGPKDITNVITVYLYNLAFVQWKFGHAAAAGIVTFFIAMVAGVFYLWLIKDED